MTAPSQPAAQAKGAHTPGTVVDRGRYGAAIRWPAHGGYESAMPSVEFAESVVRAVNSHAELVSALRAVDDYMSGREPAPKLGDIERMIKAALAKTGER